MCLGIGVEFCAHLLHAFLEERGSCEERSAAALADVGAAVLSGITLTKVAGGWGGSRRWGQGHPVPETLRHPCQRPAARLRTSLSHPPASPVPPQVSRCWPFPAPASLRCTTSGECTDFALNGCGGSSINLAAVEAPMVGLFASPRACLPACLPHLLLQHVRGAGGAGRRARPHLPARSAGRVWAGGVGGGWGLPGLVLVLVRLP